MSSLRGLVLWLVPAHVAHYVVEISTNYAATFLLNVSNDVSWEDLDHGLGGHFVHGVVLVVATGEILPADIIAHIEKKCEQ